MNTRLFLQSLQLKQCLKFHTRKMSSLLNIKTFPKMNNHKALYAIHFLCKRFPHTDIVTNENSINTNLNAKEGTKKKYGKGFYKQQFQQNLCDKMKDVRRWSLEEWTSIHDEAIATEIQDIAVGAFVLNACLENKNLKAAESYLEFVDATGKQPSAVALSKTIRLCSVCSSETTEEYILKLIERIEKMVVVYDHTILADVVAGLSHTSRWKDCIRLIEESRVLCNENVDNYNQVARAAFSNGELDVGWESMEKVVDSKNLPSVDACLAVVDACSNIDEERERTKVLDQFLNFCAQQELHLPKLCLERMGSWFETEYGWSSNFSDISRSGECQCCKRHLASNSLTRDEFNLLRNEFVKHVIEGKDIYLKTTPKELDSFKRFLSRTAPYDIVLDALNVAYRGNERHGSKADQLCNVIRRFKEENKKVVIIGKIHMLKWPKKPMEYVKRNAHCFFTQNITKDDPFFMYAALYSGSDTYIVSSDMLRDHKYILNDTKLEPIFHRWLQSRQLYMQLEFPMKTIHFQEPILHSTILQRDDASIHIPQSSTDAVQSNKHLPQQWLCVQTSNQKIKS